MANAVIRQRIDDGVHDRHKRAGATGLAASLGVERFFFFFNDTATTEIYTLSLHDALPIPPISCGTGWCATSCCMRVPHSRSRSEEHTSELQSRVDLVCRLLLEKKNNN